MKYITIYELHQSFEDVLLDNVFYSIAFLLAILLFIYWFLKTNKMKKEKRIAEKNNPVDYYDRSIYDKESWLDKNKLILISILFIVFNSMFLFYNRYNSIIHYMGMYKTVYVDNKYNTLEGTVDSIDYQLYKHQHPLLQRTSPGNDVFDFTVNGIKFSLDDFYQYGYNVVDKKKCIYNVGQLVKICYVYDDLIRQNVIVKIQILEVDYKNHL